MIVALAVALGAIAQSVSGVGFVLVCGPALVAALGQREGVRTALVLSMVVNAAVLINEHRHVAWRAAVTLMVPAIVTTPVAAELLQHAPVRLAEALAGAAAVLGAAALAVGLRWHAARGAVGAVGAGVLSAAMNVAAGISGPPVVLWTDNARWPRERTRSTLQVYFLAINAVALASLGLPHRPVRELALALVAVALGLAMGSVLARRVSAVVARRTTLALAAAGGLVVLIGAALD